MSLRRKHNPAAIFVFYVKLFNFLNIYTIKTLTPRKTAVLYPRISI